MDFDTLGDWCKWLERNFSNDVMIPGLPVIIRLDGNNFHTWTKGLEQPFDRRFRDLMIETTKFLVKETNAVIGYTQSDEITLILYAPKRYSEIYNGGKKQKILSKLTSKCVNFFNQKQKELLPGHNKIADFDCRIYQTPSLEVGADQLLWRELDATKNSVQMLARKYFSHTEIKNMTTQQLITIIDLSPLDNWSSIDTCFKRGTYVRKVYTERKYTSEEINNLPEKHHARTDPNLVVKRTTYEAIDMPIFSKITNKVDVVFNGAEPLVIC